MTFEKRADVSASGPEPIKRIIDRWLTANRVRQRADTDELCLAWGRAVGGGVAEHTRLIDYQGGILTVEVDSPPLLHELSTYYREEIIESLRSEEDFGSLKDVRFRAGSF